MRSSRRRFNPDRRLEASGIPRAGDHSPELQLMVARRLGLAPPLQFDHLPHPMSFLEVQLGNIDLPTYEHKDTLVSVIKENPVTICKAETGSGKSTQIPQFLMEAGFEVILSQPRRLAAEMVSRRIGQEVTQKLGPDGFELVGYQTAEKSTLRPDTRIQVVTDGLQVARELGVFAEGRGNQGGGLPRVLMIDEAHERNTNIDVLLAWAKKRLGEGSDMRVVVLSADINTERMARFFSQSGFIPPIIEIPGRSYGIEQLEEPDSTVVDQAVKYAKRGDNVLVFLPGVTEIEQTMSAVRKKLSGDKTNNYEYLSLHGKMSQQEQRLVELEYPHPKIVFATNVAETSITIPDVDTIIDSGLERRIEIDQEGTERLQVAPVSQSNCIQRAGRCGRTHPGTYVLTRLNAKVQHLPFIQREMYPIPEILRSNVDKTVLSIAAAGLDITDLPLPDPLDSSVIARSKRALQVLGALDEEKKITTRGRRMNQFPLRPNLSRMVVYGEEHNYTNNQRALLAAMVAVVESGGLPDFSPGADRSWRRMTKDSTSDLLAQLDIFISTQPLKRMVEFEEYGLNARSIDRSRELYHKLVRRMKLPEDSLSLVMNETDREKLREAIVAGMIDFVYEKKGSEYRRTSGRLGKHVMLRTISDRSVVKAKPDLIVGTPYALSSPPGRDLPERHIVQDVTKTTAQQLGEVAAELCEWVGDADTFVWKNNQPFRRQERVFRGTVSTGEFRDQPVNWSPELAREIIAIARQRPGKNLRELRAKKKESEKLYHLTGTVTRIHENQLTELMEKVSGLTKKSLTNKPMTLDMFDNALAAYIDVFEAYLPSGSERQTIIDDCPGFVSYQGIELMIAYREGKPYIAKITDEIKHDLLTTTGDLTLPDGRDILVPHKIGRASRRLTIDEYRRSVRTV